VRGAVTPDVLGSCVERGEGFGSCPRGNHLIMRNRPKVRSRALWAECGDFVELARRMSIPADIAIHEFIDLGTRPRPANPTNRTDATPTAVAIFKD
jgi:hypothetical protein